MQDVIAALNKPLPIISDFLGEDVTMLDLARYFGYNNTASFIEAMAEVIDIVNHFDTIGDATLIDLGGFNLDNIISRPEFDVRQEGKDLSGLDSLGSALDGLLNVTTPTVSPTQQFADAAQDFNGFNATWRAADSVSRSYKDPKKAFKLLLGQNVALFEYDMPAMSASFNYSQSFSLGSIAVIPITVELGGGMGVSADWC